MINDLLEELGSKNQLRVVVYRGKTNHGRLSYDRGEQMETKKVQPLGPAVILQDQIRMLKGLKPIFLGEALRRFGGDLRCVVPNLRTNVGIDYVAVQLGGSASATVAKYIANTNNTNAANAANTSSNTTNTQICWGTDTTSDAAASTSRGEYSATSGSGGGLQRAAASYAHTTSVASYTQSKTFTATGACTNMQAVGLFDNATKQSGTLYLETVYTATTLANTDQLSFTWTVNI